MRFLGIALIVAAGAFAPPLAAQDHSTGGIAPVDLSALAPSEVRRLDHYADKIIDELMALSDSEKHRDSEGETLHGEAVQVSAERYMLAALKAGLEADRANGYFRARMAGNYSGDLPSAFANTDETPNVQDLLDGAHISTHQTAGTGGSYVDSVREFGKDTFNN